MHILLWIMTNFLHSKKHQMGLVVLKYILSISRYNVRRVKINLSDCDTCGLNKNSVFDYTNRDYFLFAMSCLCIIGQVIEVSGCHFPNWDAFFSLSGRRCTSPEVTWCVRVGWYPERIFLFSEEEMELWRYRLCDRWLWGKGHWD